MLAGVILHPAEARLPVDGAIVSTAGLNLTVYIMQDFAVFLVRIENTHITYHAAVARLAAALGKKRRPVKGHKVSLSVLFAGGHRCRKGLHVAVDIVKLFSHFTRSVLFFYDNNIFLRIFQSGSTIFTKRLTSYWPQI